MVSRRDFLKIGGASALSLYAASRLGVRQRAQAFSASDNLKKFIQPLRLPGADIPIATPDTVNPGWWQPGVTHYTIDIGAYTDQLHPDLPPEGTRLRGYGQGGDFRHLGGIIAAHRDEPVQITFRNNLPSAHILPIDRTIMGADMGDNRADVHLHGGFVPWVTDGGPHAWWTPDGMVGDSFQSQFLHPGAAPNEAEYYYPNQQSARLMWYHDHVLGLTRLNAYAGLATAYVIYDDYELALVAANHLPGPLDPRTLYLVFQDKAFVGDTTDMNDPLWYDLVDGTRHGDLWYPHTYDTDRYGPLDGATISPLPEPSCIPEFFGDTMLVNGTVYPYMEVEPRQYRLRMLNACQAKFLNPRLLYAEGTAFPDSTEPNLKAPGPAFIQIGTEGGFLPSAAMLNGPKQPTLVLAPAERADLIVDFRNVAPGSLLILYSDAPSPYPTGDPDNDVYPGNRRTPESMIGYGPNTRTLMQFRVMPLSGPADPPITLPARSQFTPTDPFLIKQSAGQPTTYTATGSYATIRLADGSKVQARVRSLTLNESFDAYGRLLQALGTNEPTSTGKNTLSFARGYAEPTTETASAGEYQVWEIANLTMDTHPMHFHLVNAQILWRRKFNTRQYDGTPAYSAAAYGPDANELGWKETIRMNPGEVTSVLMKFQLPTVPFDVPASNRTGGNEYVWHCHILEHEEHDMMRPFVVT